MNHLPGFALRAVAYEAYVFIAVVLRFGLLCFFQFLFFIVNIHINPLFSLYKLYYTAINGTSKLFINMKGDCRRMQAPPFTEFILYLSHRPEYWYSG